MMLQVKCVEFFSRDCGYLRNHTH